MHTWCYIVVLVERYLTGLFQEHHGLEQLNLNSTNEQKSFIATETLTDSLNVASKSSVVIKEQPENKELSLEVKDDTKMNYDEKSKIDVPTLDVDEEPEIAGAETESISVDIKEGTKAEEIKKVKKIVKKKAKKSDKSESLKEVPMDEKELPENKEPPMEVKDDTKMNYDEKSKIDVPNFSLEEEPEFAGAETESKFVDNEEVTKVEETKKVKKAVKKKAKKSEMSDSLKEVPMDEKHDESETEIIDDSKINSSLTEEEEIVPDNTDTVSNVSASVPEEMLDISNENMDQDNVDFKLKESRKQEEPTKQMSQKKPIKMKPKPETSNQKENLETLPFGLKLKKTETVKSKIAETKLELPKLKHHEFENVPEDTSIEEMTKIKLTKLIVNKDEREKIKKIKRKVKPKNNPDPMEEHSEAETEDSNLLDKNQEENSINTAEFGDVKSIDIDVEEEEEIEDEKDENLYLPEVASASKKPQPVKEAVSERSKPKEEHPIEESIKIPQLKPTKTSKPKIKEAEREIVVLKHHEFESKPLETDEEKIGSIQLGSVIKTKPIKPKKVPKVKSKTATEDEDHEPTQVSETDSEDINKIENFPEEIIEVEDAEMKDEGEDMPQTPVNSHNYNADMVERRSKSVSLSEKVEKVSDDADTLSNASSLVPEEILDISNNKKEEPSKQISQKKQIRMKPKPDIAKQKEDVESLLFGKKLRKTETVKSKVEETRLELPKLKHHEFENVPKDTSNEEVTIIKLSEEILSRDEKEMVKKVKRKVRTKKVVPMGEPSEIEDVVIKDDVEKPEFEDEKMENKVVDIPEAPITVPTSNEEKLDEEPQPIKKVASKRNKLTEEKAKDEPVSLPKLKPAKTNKSKIEEAERENVQLKHHEFENKPLETDEEKCGPILLGTPIDVKPTKVKQVPKIKTKKASKVPDPVSAEELDVDEEKINIEEIMPEVDLEDSAKVLKTESSHNKPAIKMATQVGIDVTKESASLKERDPIVPPAAAVAKKHSDTEKVEIPAYLNFPSDQGIIMNEDMTEDTTEKLMSPESTISEVIHEDSGPKLALVENQTVSNISKKVKRIKKPKADQIIPIIRETPVTNETVTEEKVSSLLFP